MSGGGLGMAEQFAQEFDPSLLSQGAAAQSPGAQSTGTQASERRLAAARK